MCSFVNRNAQRCTTDTHFQFRSFCKANCRESSAPQRDTRSFAISMRMTSGCSTAYRYVSHLGHDVTKRGDYRCKYANDEIFRTDMTIISYIEQGRSNGKAFGLSSRQGARAYVPVLASLGLSGLVITRGPNLRKPKGQVVRIVCYQTAEMYGLHSFPGSNAQGHAEIVPKCVSSRT